MSYIIWFKSLLTPITPLVFYPLSLRREGGKTDLSGFGVSL